MGTLHSTQFLLAGSLDATEKKEEEVKSDAETERKKSDCKCLLFRGMFLSETFCDNGLKLSLDFCYQLKWNSA